MSDEKKVYAGFAQFADRESRDRFVESHLDAQPELKERAYLPERRPTIVFENLSSAEREAIRAALGGVGKWFDDVQFQPM